MATYDITYTTHRIKGFKVFSCEASSVHEALRALKSVQEGVRMRGFRRTNTSSSVRADGD